MNDKKYLEDLKNIKPLPLDKIPVNRKTSLIKLKPLAPSSIQFPSSKVQAEGSAINNKQSKESSSMEPLKSSKTMWGFGIAVFIYIMQSLLIAFNITSPDNLILKTIIEVIVAISGFFGVYGVRDALRKLSY